MELKETRTAGERLLTCARLGHNIKQESKELFFEVVGLVGKLSDNLFEVDSLKERVKILEQEKTITKDTLQH